MYKKMLITIFCGLLFVMNICGQKCKSLINEAQRLSTESKIDSAIAFADSAIKTCRIEFGEHDSIYAVSLSNLATYEEAKGNNNKAELLLKKAISIDKALYPLAYQHYAVTLNNLATLYVNTHNFNLADTLFLQALRIAEETEGKNNTDYIIRINNLAVLYMGEGKLSKAGSYIKEALIIYKKINPAGVDKEEYYRTLLGNLAEVDAEQNENEAADSAFDILLRDDKANLSENDLGLAYDLNNAAGFQEKMGDYKNAEYGLVRASQIIINRLGINNNQCGTMLHNLACVYYKENKLDNSIACFIMENEVTRRLLRQGMLYLSEKELSDFMQNFQGFNAVQSICLKEQNDSLINTTLNNVLMIKSVGLQNITRLRNGIASSSDTLVKNKYKAYIAAQQIINSEMQKKGNPRSGLAEVKSEVNDLEKQLMRLSPEFSKQVESNNLTWRNIQKTLMPNEAVVEYIDFRIWDKNWVDSTFYAAYLIRNTGKPKMVKLCELKQLQKQLNIFDSLEHINSNNDTKYPEYHNNYINTIYDSTDSGNLYALLWQPIDSLLKGVDIVYYSPSGLLNRINVSAVPYSGKQLLSDKYQLHLLPSTRNKIDYQPTRISDGNMLLYGSINYDMNERQLKDSTKQYFSSSSTRKDFVRSRSGYYFTPLPGSVREKNEIAKLAKSNNINCISKSGYGASEESFYHYTETSSISPAIIHFSTHGFAYPDPQVKKGKNNEPFYVNNDNPLLRCGLALAGANNTDPELGQSKPDSLQDGILTGAEISNVNLRQTRLVVLSACETGLGKIDSNEGVYGLQRAFKMAGAGNLIMSLWDVSDSATTLFMTTFYTHLFKDKWNVYKSFTATQKNMREVDKYKDPYYWAAFILME